MKIEGVADNDTTADGIRRVLSTALPSGYEARDAITVTSAKKATDSCESTMRETSAKGINFASAKADLTPDSTQTLKDLAEAAKKCPSFDIEIQGYADAEGTDKLNQKLSDRRAHAVAACLTGKGVDPKRLKIVGYGASRPIADNATEEGRAKNRRIEFNVKVN